MGNSWSSYDEEYIPEHRNIEDKRRKYKRVKTVRRIRPQLYEENNLRIDNGIFVESLDKIDSNEKISEIKPNPIQNDIEEVNIGSHNIVPLNTKKQTSKRRKTVKFREN